MKVKVNVLCSGMRFLHTADLHLGQVLYQNYTREDEHDHFFRQLDQWCKQYNPDALLVSGDIFDIQQPSAATRRRFNEYFAALHRTHPSMRIVITAGNHDSAARIQADNSVWDLAGVTLIGMPPTADCLQRPNGWQEQYIVRMPQGYIIAMPYFVGNRHDMLQSLLDYVSRENSQGLPVVMMAHMALSGMDATGHPNWQSDSNTEIGTLRTIDPADTGTGYDYLALGHIHRPQTLGHHNSTTSHPAPLLRYSGSPLHVNCDEKYHHTVSLVDIDRHGGTVHLTELPIEQLRHFYELPSTPEPFTNAQEALEAISHFASERGSGYFRLRMDYQAALPADFNQQVYQLIEPYHGEVRYNPKILWENTPASPQPVEVPLFQVADLQQMTDPMEFVRQTADHYPGLDLNWLSQAFKEVQQEMENSN